MLKEEYNSDMEQKDYSKIYEYESMGKIYAGEKACISLTSWKARINTVSKTLYSLIKMCHGFHIVLVLSKDEFPLMEKELPDNLMLFVENKLIELFWIRPNLKSFKKVLFTMDKYRDVPIISADDDCIYTSNYAQILYDEYVKSKCFITFKNKKFKSTCGQWGNASLYPPYYFREFGLSLLNDDIIKYSLDDIYYALLRIKMKFNEYKFVPFQKRFFRFDNSIEPLETIYTHKDFSSKITAIYNKILKCY